MEEVAAGVPDPALALITVGESDLPPVMANLPMTWRDRVGLIQNELLPRDWHGAGVAEPTVAVVWFEKKPGQDVKVILPTPVGGPNAALVAGALEGTGIPAVVVEDVAALEHELVVKNLYILTANIAGLVTGGTVGELWHDHRELAADVAGEVLDIQEWLVGRLLEKDRLIDRMERAFAADPDHGATGRSAPMRLARALGHAADGGIETPTMERIRQETVRDA